MKPRLACDAGPAQRAAAPLRLAGNGTMTALGLLRADKRVWVVGNASGSRRPADHAAAMDRLSRAGATVVSHEMVLFEWLADCRHPRFREVLALLKAAG